MVDLSYVPLSPKIFAKYSLLYDSSNNNIFIIRSVKLIAACFVLSGYGRSDITDSMISWCYHQAVTVESY